MANPAWKVAAEISDGYTSLNPVLLKKYQGHELEALQKEIEKITREIRAQAIAVDDVEATQTRNRKLLRMSQSIAVLQNFRLKNKPSTSRD